MEFLGLIFASIISIALFIYLLKDKNKTQLKKYNNTLIIKNNKFFKDDFIKIFISIKKNNSKAK